jgi:hypothetical protein
MAQLNRREALKLGVFASAAAIAPKWVEASSERNVALNRAAWASSSGDLLNTGHMSTDGLANTKWQSADAEAQWIYVDLGGDCTVHSVVLRWGSNCAAQYKVQVSTDRNPSPETGRVENWTEVHTIHDGRGGVEKIVFPETHACYVRLELSGKASREAMSFQASRSTVLEGTKRHPHLCLRPKPMARCISKAAGG